MIYIVTALYVEAKPLIDWYNLKRDMEERVFQIFANDDMKLIITGVGKINSAIGTAHLLSHRCTLEDDCVVNIGICGSPTADLGEIYIINKIKDHETGKDFYPDMLVMHPFKEASIETFSYPVISGNQLQEDLCDMESSGFFQSASKYLDVHRIALIKVVSDRLESTQLTKKFIEGLLKEKMSDIDRFLSLFKNIIIDEPLLSDEEVRKINDICSNMRLTETQRSQLFKTCMQYKARTGKRIDFLEKYMGLKVMTKGERNEYFRLLLKEFEAF